MSANEAGGGGFSLQQQINQQFANVNNVVPAMIRTAQPVQQQQQQQQPVYAQATVIQGQPIAMARIV